MPYGKNRISAISDKPDDLYSIVGQFLLNDQLMIDSHSEEFQNRTPMGITSFNCLVERLYYIFKTFILVHVQGKSFPSTLLFHLALAIMPLTQ